MILKNQEEQNFNLAVLIRKIPYFYLPFLYIITFLITFYITKFTIQNKSEALLHFVGIISTILIITIALSNGKVKNILTLIGIGFLAMFLINFPVYIFAYIDEDLKYDYLAWCGVFYGIAFFLLLVYRIFYEVKSNIKTFFQILVSWTLSFLVVIDFTLYFLELTHYKVTGLPGFIVTIIEGLKTIQNLYYSNRFIFWKATGLVLIIKVLLNIEYRVLKNGILTILNDRYIKTKDSFKESFKKLRNDINLGVKVTKFTVQLVTKAIIIAIKDHFYKPTFEGIRWLIVKVIFPLFLLLLGCMMLWKSFYFINISLFDISDGDWWQVILVNWKEVISANLLWIIHIFVIAFGLKRIFPEMVKDRKLFVDIEETISIIYLLFCTIVILPLMFTLYFLDLINSIGTFSCIIILLSIYCIIIGIFYKGNTLKDIINKTKSSHF